MPFNALRRNGSGGTSAFDSAAVIRAEIFSVERLEQHAISLAVAQRISARPATVRPLTARLRDNHRALLDAHRAIAKAIDQQSAITPSAEWLVDNFHVVEAQIRQIRDDLPPGYYRQLPKLAEGPFAGYPRVLGLAWAFVAHTDSRFDPHLLTSFVSAYQTEQPLTIGELWAIAITLRIVLVENLRRAADSIASARAVRGEADNLADRMLGTGGRPGEPLAILLREWDGVELSTTFSVQLLQRLRDHDPEATPALAWLEARLAAAGTNADAVVRDEHQRQGASTVTVRNIIMSMRSISAVDWADLFETMSLVDAVLREDAGFVQSAFPTRDRYRRAVEELSRGSPHSQLEIAHRAMQTAIAGEPPGNCGYALIGAGRRSLEAAVGYRPTLRRWPARVSASMGIRGYITGIALLASLVVAWPTRELLAMGAGTFTLLVLAVTGFVLAIDAAMALVNSSVISRFRAKPLPELELGNGIDASMRTLVVVPIMLTTQDALDAHLERLEIHHLASLDGDISFALLSDWTDAANERVDGDGALLASAIAGVGRLNHQYGPAAAGDRFLLLHRNRLWNAAQGAWMGWERKRGKLHELNRLLRGAMDTSFITPDGKPPDVPSGVRYVITLDADTQLPRDAVRRMVGKMAHPLNTPRFDGHCARVVEGYAILQPRIASGLPLGFEGSHYQRLVSGAGGIDPYASAVSDIYQDLCGEGSYVGKGIYDVDAFEAAMAGRVAENALLSHDLFEGIFARAGLASDIELVDEYPTRYAAAAARSHRWARGDWQLLPWVFGCGSAGIARCKKSIPLLGRWKMFDNLRRTLVAPASVLGLAVAWTLPLPSAALWTTFVIVMLAIPNLPSFLSGLIPFHRRISWRSHFNAVLADAQLAVTRTALELTLLAHQAWLMCDAIGRTLFRLYISQKNLLEWVTSQEQNNRRLDALGYFHQMAGGVAIAIAVLLLVATGQFRMELALPFALLWILSPLVAFWLSQPSQVVDSQPISDADARALRLVARRAWRYFETFVTAADNMLPPDNFQEEPRPVLAHRTSPTNMGLYLLSIVTARDLGWAGTVDTVDRLESALDAMQRLERCRGHFYNWYDTQDLRPLEPKYISSVDSGNLAAHLLTLANACEGMLDDMLDSKAADQRTLAGIGDAIALARETLGETVDKALAEALDAMAVQLAQRPAIPSRLAERLPVLANRAGVALERAAQLSGDGATMASAETTYWATATLHTIESHQRDLTPAPPDSPGELTQRLNALSATARTLASAMRFDFLFDPERKLLSIGYRVIEGCLDPSCYDLLASEARLASFVAIANGDLPARHWFRLGRAVIRISHGAALISWSGSMFEYLMPSLVMRAPTGSLLEQTNRLIVGHQQAYGSKLGVPWGISESAYNARDLERTYQYSSFGLPGLGLKRGLGENVVVAPYATALAAMVDPHGAALNFARLRDTQALGQYGFYEALDYTPRRLPKSDSFAVVRAYFAHHQGMTIVALANTLLDGVMRKRFHAEPCIQATELLLQEKTPREVAAVLPSIPETGSLERSEVMSTLPSMIDTPHHATPRTRVLSNGRYSVMLTAAGSGYSHWGDLAITRWGGDITCDASGSYVFLRDVTRGKTWSAGYQPSGVEPDVYEVRFSEHLAEFMRRDGDLFTMLDVVVSAECDAEVRRVNVMNMGDSELVVEISSYAEIVLAPRAADEAHPAFSKLFVVTEYEAAIGAILATRRRRSPHEPEVWAAHLAVVEGECVDSGGFETDRARFVGRGRPLRSPLALSGAPVKAGSAGTVLDPIFSLTRCVRLPPGSTARVAFWTLVASSRDEVLDLVDQHRDVPAFDRAATLAWTQAQVELHHLGIAREEAMLFQRLAGHILYNDATLRPSSEVLRRRNGGQGALWAHGISGDLPIVLVRIDDADDLGIVRQLLRAFEYWRTKQLNVDLVILNERLSSYVQDLQTALETLSRAGLTRPRIHGESLRGAVYILRSDIIPGETRLALLAAASAVLLSRHGSLAEQLDRLEQDYPALPPTVPNGRVHENSTATTQDVPDLEFFNGLGGFTAAGDEYVTVLRDGQTTPVPWINVIANPAFGFQVSAEGSGCTWAGNSRENRLTPWSNDPVEDRSGEVFYIRDDDTGKLFGPTALPLRHESGTYVARHGRGYSRFEHTHDGIALDLLQFVPADDAIKVSRLKLHNLSGRTRRLTLTAYVEWVLGTSRSTTAAYVATEMDTVTGSMLARNLRSGADGGVAFMDLGGQQTSLTGNRMEFIGRNGSLERPAALARSAVLSGRTGAGLDPCGALQTSLVLAANAAIEIVCFLGQAATTSDAQAVIARWRGADIEAALQSVREQWSDVLDAVTVQTPDRAFDIMHNGWLQYQTLACRLWARSAFYQASGAYGFRDQLQDTLALIVPRPDLARAQILRAAGRQFVEGDVQHWWLPETGRGVRTRVSDNRIWLCYCVAYYLEATADTAILDEVLPFLDGPALHDSETDNFFLPTVSEDTATLFEHCARALEISLATGPHGLPLIGSGDWNDGMSSVGAQGRGESIWLGWFLHLALSGFALLADTRGEQARAAAWRAHAATLRAALEQHGWDGDWYRRAYFDDGTPMGSSAGSECRIDSIAQSWSVISGAAEAQRAERAMASLDRHLVRRDDGLVLLLTPPFDTSVPDPGYIQAYPPGIRENGGQYTHAGAWAVIAFAQLGDGDKACELMSLLNPINHALTLDDAMRYKVEPYVVAADIYSEAPHIGRGGWTWYTGSASWLYRAGLEWILGCRIRGAALLIDPCVPRGWTQFKVKLRYRGAQYEIAFENPNNVNRGLTLLQLDDFELPVQPGLVPLVEDGATHQVRVVLG